MSFLNKLKNKFIANDAIRPIVLQTSSQEESDALMAFGSEQAGLQIFKGEVEHAYESNFTKQTDICPRCEAATELMYAHFVYATEYAPRVMSGPGGFFCTKCPTVIINDAQVAIVAKPRFQYGGVCAIETTLGKPNLFSTMNGKKSAYVLDQYEQFSGLISSVNYLKIGDNDPALMLNSAFNSRLPMDKAAADKRKAKAKAAKKARKANRK
jgi:hypothetical protein